MTRLLETHWGPTTPAQARDTVPWIASGLLTESTLIKAEPGILGGVVVTALDDGGDIIVRVWDSESATLTDDDCIAKITVADVAANYQHSFGTPSPSGVEATKGIYVEIVSGDPDVNVYYK